MPDPSISFVLSGTTLLCVSFPIYQSMRLARIRTRMHHTSSLAVLPCNHSFILFFLSMFLQSAACHIRSSDDARAPTSLGIVLSYVFQGPESEAAKVCGCFHATLFC